MPVGWLTFLGSLGVVLLLSWNTYKEEEQEWKL
jgi:hypothetical protein